jgi:ribose 5-phosphate isomerase B
MIALGSDFVGLILKKQIMEYLDSKGIAYRDYGAYSTEPCDYPVYGLMAANAVKDGVCDRGIVFCGTGVGISIVANKVKGIRCVCCSEPYSALMSREHNDANMLALGTRVVGGELAKMIVEAWLNGEYQHGRHQNRLDMISQIEQAGALDV